MAKYVSVEKIFLISFVFILSGCTPEWQKLGTQLKGMGAEILLPNTQTAQISQMERQISQIKKQSGLKLITEHPEINHTLYKQNEKEISKLISDSSYYHTKILFISAYGLSLSEPIVAIDKKIANITGEKNNYVAPKTYEKCIDGADWYNNYGYMGFQCYESIVKQHSELWRKQETQRVTNAYNSQLSQLYQMRQKLVSKAKAVGVDTTLAALNKQSEQQYKSVQQRMNLYCDKLLGANSVTWLQIENNYRTNERRLVSARATATKGKDNCISNIYAGFNSNQEFNSVLNEGKKRFFEEYSSKFGLKIEEMQAILDKYLKERK